MSAFNCGVLWAILAAFAIIGLVRSVWRFFSQE